MSAWRDVPGYEGSYRVSDDGRVLSVARKARTASGFRTVPAKELKQAWAGAPTSRYLCVELFREGSGVMKRVHRLVLLAFVGDQPVGMLGLHNDGDRANNVLTNLRWGTQSENALDAVAHGVHPNATKTVCKRGHDLADAYVHARGRQCRKCANYTRQLRKGRQLADIEPES